MTNSTTLGQFLNSADANLEKNGGFAAVADCTRRLVTLYHTGPKGRTDLMTCTLPEQEAPEDVASALLENFLKYPVEQYAQPDQIEFARNIYFPISIQ